MLQEFCFQVPYLISDKGSFDGYRPHGRTPAVMTPVAAPPSELRSKSKAVEVNGELLDKQKLVDRGYSGRFNEGAVVSSVPSASVGGTRKVWSGVQFLFDPGLSILC